MFDEPTSEQWEAWRADNERLLKGGYMLTTCICLDGSIEDWAERGSEKFRRIPPWKQP